MRPRLRAAAAAAVMVSAGAFAAPIDDFEHAMERGRHTDAAEIAVAEAARTEDAVWAYNAACALARAGMQEESAAWALRAAERGFGGVRSFETDPDLDTIRGHADFVKALEIVRARAAERFEAFRAAAEAHEPAVVLPPRFDPKAPTPLLIALHGTGGRGQQMAEAWRAAAEAVGAIVVAPDALRPVGDGFSWTFRDEAEWLVLRTVERARERWTIGPVILAGHSQGANIAFLLGQTHPDVFDAVVPVNGHYEADAAALPTEGDRPAWYLLIGARDPQVRTFAEADRVFRGAGMSVRRRVLVRAGGRAGAGDGPALVSA